MSKKNKFNLIIFTILNGVKKHYSTCWEKLLIRQLRECNILLSFIFFIHFNYYFVKFCFIQLLSELDIKLNVMKLVGRTSKSG